MTTALPSLLHTSDEQELRGSVRRLLSDRADWSTVLRRMETGSPYDTDTWRRLAAETGVAGLAVPEPLGGAGASWRETAVVAEELGRSVAIVPFLGSAVLATAALLHAGDEELLPALAAGERTAALAVPLSTWPGRAWPTSVAVERGLLTGVVTSVADARAADVLVVPANGPDGPSLWAVDAFQVTPRTSLDLTRPLGDVRLSGAAGRLLAQGEQASAALQQALLAGAGILASEQLGLAEQCLETTVGHLTTRYQFGRAIGSFQGLKHRAAGLWVEVTRARAVARYAAGCLATADALRRAEPSVRPAEGSSEVAAEQDAGRGSDATGGSDAAGGDDVPVAVAVAGSLCSDVAVLAAEECVQLHGGLGFTWEHPAHLWLKRAKADQLALGTPDRHRTALAELVDLPIG